MDIQSSASPGYDQRFDERLFEEQLSSLREQSRAIAQKQTNLKYTIFAVRFFWVVVVVPFLTGAACAFLLGR